MESLNYIKGIQIFIKFHCEMIQKNNNNGSSIELYKTSEWEWNILTSLNENLSKKWQILFKY